MVAARVSRPAAFSIVLTISLVGPLFAIAWLTTHASLNRSIVLPSQHFLIVTIVSFLAAAVALLVARFALRLEQLQVLLVTLGFLAVASFFLVHALSTPSVLLQAGSSMPDMGGYYSTTSTPAAPAPPPSYSGTVVGVSAFLSLLIPSLLFASASYAPLTAGLKRRVAHPAATVSLLLTAVLALYGALAAWQTRLVAGIPVATAPVSYVVAAVTVGLLSFAAWHQARSYLATRLPVHGALSLSFLLLAEAQVSMAFSPFWTLSWWGYHLLMLAAVVLALGALGLELDRRRGLERFLPSEVVERVVSGDLLRQAGQQRQVTVLFADLRDSTALAERLPPEAVIEFMNLYVGTLARSVFLHHGMLEKFTGDGLTAVFGVLDDGSQGAVSAVEATLHMRRAMRALNEQRERDGMTTMRFGVGMHSGRVVLGAVGIPERSDFLAIGDTVNTASRLEALCKEFGVDVVLSRQTLDCLPAGAADVRLLGSVSVRGRQSTVEVFTLS